MCCFRFIVVLLFATLAELLTWRPSPAVPLKLLQQKSDSEWFMGISQHGQQEVLMEGDEGMVRNCMGRTSYTQRLVAITLVLLAVLSPLYIDRRMLIELDDNYYRSEGGSLPVWLPFVLIILVFVINLTCFMDKKIMRFDPYWIHRFGGSSCGITMLLLVLGFVLKCKASLRGEV